MKKLVTLFLAMLMIFSLVACDGENSSNNNDTPNPTKPSNAPSYDYDPDDLQSMLSFITFEGEAASTAVTTEAEALVEKLGGSYSTYDTNKTAVTDFYSAALVRADELYTSFQVVSVDYFKCVAAQGLDDYDTWDDAMGEFYDVWDDAMGDYYDAWDEAFGDIYDQCDDLISDASDDLEYEVYSDAWSAMYEEYSDSWSVMYEAYSDAWSKTYSDYSAVWSGFYGGETDVDSILKDSAEEAEKGDNDNEDDESSDDDSTATTTFYEDIEAIVVKDVEDTIVALTTEWETLIADIDSYDSYVANADKIAALYEKMNNESARLCIRMREYSIDYAYAILSSEKSADDMYDDLEGIYDLIYDEAGDDIYDGIYDGLLDEMYDSLYSGVLDERDDDVEYSDWSDIRSNEYEMWSDTRSDTYEQWSDFRSDVYEFWSDIRSEMWGDDAEGAQDGINNFRKDVEKLLSKVGSDDEATAETTIPDETHDDAATAGIRPEFKRAMDSYEAFFDEYVEFMKKYMESEDVASMMADYADMMTQYADTMRALEEIDEDELSAEEVLYYSEAMARISQKLLEIA